MCLLSLPWPSSSFAKLPVHRELLAQGHWIDSEVCRDLLDGELIPQSARRVLVGEESGRPERFFARDRSEESHWHDELPSILINLLLVSVCAGEREFAHR